MFKRNRMKKGVASFYIVVFSTLVLVIVAASFATVIVSEITRTSNDDLSQSAYDSALAGVEDAKVAFADYQRCIEAGEKKARGIINDGVVTCGEIIYWMEEENPDCYMIGHILGRIPESSPNQNDNGEVPLGITSSGSGGKISVLNQAYTCVKADTKLPDYRSTISAARQTRLVKIRLTENEAEVLDHIKLSWYVVKPETKTNFAPTKSVAGVPVAKFWPKNETQMIVPPTIEVQLLQTSKSFSVDQLMDSTRNGQTDRATLYLVPTNSEEVTRKSISAAEVASTNNPRVKNLPYLIKCDGESTEFVCSADITLPEPIGGDRSGDTFMLALSLPYRQPETDFSVEFYCNKDTQDCARIVGEDNKTTGLITLHDAQVEVDSTGRANDLFRRVKVRLETQDVAFPYPVYALQVLDNDKNYQLTKNMIVTCEYSLWASNSGFGQRPDDCK